MWPDCRLYMDTPSSLFVVLTNICFRSIAHNLIKPIASPILMLDLLTNHSLRFFTWYETVYYRLMKRVIKSLLLTVCTQHCVQKPLMLTKKYKWSFLSRTDKYWIYGMLLGKKISKRLFSKWIFAKTTSFCWSKKHISLFNYIILLIGMKKSFYDNQAVSLWKYHINISYKDHWWETYQVEWKFYFSR